MSKSKTSIVAIVGRANVGKSSLFNTIIKRREAIVADEPGTTRDSITAKASFKGNDFWLVDTAGMKNPEDDFEFTIQEQIQQATESADVIVILIEADLGISDEERRLAKQALKSKKPVILGVNKADKTPKATPDDYNRLGIKNIVLTSTTQNKGIDELLEQIVGRIPRATIKQDSDKNVLALIGRPNVGKSFLFNKLAKKQQAIVAEVAGTTRDINRATIRYEKKTIELLDTAGIRRSGKIERGVENFSVIRSLRAIEEADVCLLVMDANELNTQLDQKIAGLVKEAGKGLIIIVSKWDSVEKTAFTRDSIAPQIQHSFAFVPWAPLIFTSSITGQNVTKIFEMFSEVITARQTKVKTPELNRWLRNIVDIHPPAGLKNTNPKLNYIIQEDDNRTNFKVYGSDTKFLHWSYKRFMDRKLRETFEFTGTPVRFWFFDKKDDNDKRESAKKPIKRSSKNIA